MSPSSLDARVQSNKSLSRHKSERSTGDEEAGESSEERNSKQKQQEQELLDGSMGESVTKRLQQELMGLMKEADPHATAFPDGDNLFNWSGSLTGADETVYAGLVYKISIKFPADYPYTAPTIKFVTPCFHPNVDGHGNICLDILKEKWSATYSVATILQSLRSLLSDPNNESPLNGTAAQLWDNQADYKQVLLKKYRDATSSDTGSQSKK